MDPVEEVLNNPGNAGLTYTGLIGDEGLNLFGKVPQRG